MKKGAKSILVTGGAGYIGAHTCKALYEAGYEPVTFDNLVHGHRNFVKWGPFEHGDIRDLHRLNAVMRKYAFDAVIHFAAYAYVGESVYNPSKYYRNNLIGTLTLLEAMIANHIKYIVFSSSCATYGNPVKRSVSEDHPQNPLSPYGRSKLMVEKILNDYDAGYEIKNVILRYFNAAGADPQKQIGEKHDPETHLIPLVLKAFSESETLKIFGNNYDTPDGTCIRDYVHVGDIAEAHVRTVEYLKIQNQSNSFNIGTNKGHSVLDIVRAAEAVLDSSIAIDFCARRSGDADLLVSDSRKISAQLGWSPRFEDIHTIIDHAWQWNQTALVF